MNYQGSNETAVSNRITLTCITPEARDLLDTILERCPADVREGGSDRFLEWLHGSGLIRTAFTVEQLQQADRQWVARMASVGTQRKDHVYGCAYWLVRYSGMVEPNLPLEQ